MGLKEDLIELFTLSFNHWECLEVAKGAKPIKDPKDKAYERQLTALVNLKKLAAEVSAALSKRETAAGLGVTPKLTKVNGFLKAINSLDSKKEALDKSLVKGHDLIQKMVTEINK